MQSKPIYKTVSVFSYFFSYQFFQVSQSFKGLLKKLSHRTCFTLTNQTKLTLFNLTPSILLRRIKLRNSDTLNHPSTGQNFMSTVSRTYPLTFRLVSIDQTPGPILSTRRGHHTSTHDATAVCINQQTKRGHLFKSIVNVCWSEERSVREVDEWELQSCTWSCQGLKQKRLNLPCNHWQHVAAVLNTWK